MDAKGHESGKARLRQMLRERLTVEVPQVRAGASRMIHGHLFPGIRTRKLVAFMPMDLEPDILPVIRQFWSEGSSVVLPRVNGDDLALHEVRGPEQLERGTFGIMEPVPGLPEWKPEPAVCLVPGMAFDAQGYRLGRGRGYYDRLLGRLGSRVETVGIFFSCQEVSAVPREAHDWPLNGILTEAGWRRIPPHPGERKECC